MIRRRLIEARAGHPFHSIYHKNDELSSIITMRSIQSIIRRRSRGGNMNHIVFRKLIKISS